MDVQSRKAQVIAGNIANADTPGYVAKELDFNDYLQEAAHQSSLPVPAELGALSSRAAHRRPSSDVYRSGRQHG